MATLTGNKFNAFIEAVFEGKHDFENDTFKIMKTLVAPVATNSVKADLTEIAAGNGYVAGGAEATVGSSSQTSGNYSGVISGNDVLTASGGAIADFRYSVLYNDTAANKDLVGWWDAGVTKSLGDGESYTLATDGVVIGAS
jgi:hypothetical protein